MFKRLTMEIKAWWFNKFYTYSMSPKGLAMMNYLKNDLEGVEQQRIDIYDETIQVLAVQGVTKEEFYSVLRKGANNA